MNSESKGAVKKREVAILEHDKLKGFIRVTSIKENTKVLNTH